MFFTHAPSNGSHRSTGARRLRLRLCAAGAILAAVTFAAPSVGAELFYEAFQLANIGDKTAVWHDHDNEPGGGNTNIQMEDCQTHGGASGYEGKVVLELKRRITFLPDASHGSDVFDCAYVDTNNWIAPHNGGYYARILGVMGYTSGTQAYLGWATLLAAY